MCIYSYTYNTYTNNIINNKEMSFKSIGEHINIKQEEFWICLYDVIVDDEREKEQNKKNK